ncbi:MAG: LUD domain-containing protein [Acidobacteria bacterium]|nr:LUD domain-containing protein [Acidobacteriota bacterium]
MSRSAILERVRRCGTGTSVPELPQKLPEFPCYQDAAAQFQSALQAAGGTFLDARSAGTLGSALERVLQETGVHEIYWDGHHVFEKHAISYTLRDPQAFSQSRLLHSFHYRGSLQFPLLLNSRPYQLQHLAKISLAVSSAEYGVAETGTVVHEVRPGSGRLLTALPAAHVVLLNDSDLLMNHADLFPVLSPGSTGSMTTLITGPSRTADVEKTLVMGVHGPQRFYVILMKSDQAEKRHTPP